MSKTKLKWTTDEFIEELKKVHGDKYDYSKVEYEGFRKKICIICPEHGEFWQRPSDHLRGHGCRKCAYQTSHMHHLNKTRVTNTKAFIKKSRSIFGYKYRYHKTEFLGFKTPLTITCPKHGDFVINPHVHLTKKVGCPICSNIERIKKCRSNTEEFVKKANYIHNNFYDYSKTKYVDARTKVIITCPKHGDFEQTPNKHLCGHKCPHCQKSKGETLVTRILNEYKIPFKQEVVYYNASRKFRIDFVIDINEKIYFIEYHGPQHFRPYKWFGGEEQFKLQQKRDQDLRDLVKLLNYNLLEIKYTWSETRIRNEIKMFLNAPTNSDICSKLGELLENPEEDNQQPSQGLTTLEGSETNDWNCNAEYNIDTSAQHPEMDDDIVRAI